MKYSIIFNILLFILSACGDSSDIPNSNNEKSNISSLDISNNNALAISAESNESKDNSNHKSSNFSKVTGGISGVQDNDMIIGDNFDAKVVFIEYFSPTCHACAYYHKKILPEIRKKYIDSGKILYVKRELITNKQDLDAAILARCNGSVDVYNKFINVLLDQQNSWAFNKNYRELLTNIGIIGGVPPKQYADCLNDQNSIQLLLNHTKMIARYKEFVGTPGFFINFKLFDKKYSVEEISKALDLELAKY